MRLKRIPLLGVTPFLIVLVILVSVAFSQSTKTDSEPAAPETKAAETAKEPEKAGEPAKESTWMDSVDNFFGTYFVTPMSKVLFYDFGTAKWQKNRLAKQDVDGDGKIDRDEAQGKLAAGFDDLDSDKDGFLSEVEYAVLAPAVPFVVAWLLAGGVFFTLRMSFINIRGFWHAIRLTKGDYDDEHETGEVSHFQALSSALSATVGLGNIAGVAIAVGAGGPGAIFWLILAGLVGMTSKFAECTLGQMYRKVSADGTVSGGPMHYLHDGLKEMGLGPVGVVLSDGVCDHLHGGVLRRWMCFPGWPVAGAHPREDHLVGLVALDLRLGHGGHGRGCDYRWYSSHRRDGQQDRTVDVHDLRHHGVDRPGREYRTDPWRHQDDLCQRFLGERHLGGIPGSRRDRNQTSRVFERSRHRLGIDRPRSGQDRRAGQRRDRGVTRALYRHRRRLHDDGFGHRHYGRLRHAPIQGTCHQ